jgi:hypothetical protein
MPHEVFYEVVSVLFDESGEGWDCVMETCVFEGFYISQFHHPVPSDVMMGR